MKIHCVSEDIINLRATLSVISGTKTVQSLTTLSGSLIS